MPEEEFQEEEGDAEFEADFEGFVEAEEESDGEAKPFPVRRSGFSGGKERIPVGRASIWVVLLLCSEMSSRFLGPVLR